MSLTPLDMQLLGRLVSTRTGVTLDPEGTTIAELRLGGVARKEGLAGPAEILRLLRSGSPNGLERRVVEALLNNETFFFRDLSPFEALRTAILPAALRRAAPGEPVVVWSAACSSGQEPYSVALAVRESLPDLAPRLWVIASDFSRDALARARDARYSQLEVNRGLPAAYLVRHFSKVGPDWRLSDAIRSMVEFREINLIGDLDVPSCDVILLRNVLIYLPLEHRRGVLERVRARLKPDGVLLLGTSETTLGVDDGFDLVAIGPVTCYRPRETRWRSRVKLGEADVEDVVRAIWSLTLGLALGPRKDAGPAAPVVAATVNFTGDFRGRVTLRCAPGLARRAAAAMFRTPIERVTDADVRDAVGELANMTAGNLRMFLPGATGLALPRAEEGVGGVDLCRTAFACEGESFDVRIVGA
ncbi:MAG TPA: CheR family methyltransferase [Planctomycetota bacterium]